MNIQKTEIISHDHLYIEIITQKIENFSQYVQLGQNTTLGKENQAEVTKRIA